MWDSSAVRCLAVCVQQTDADFVGCSVSFTKRRALNRDFVFETVNHRLAANDGRIGHLHDGPLLRAEIDTFISCQLLDR